MCVPPMQERIALMNRQAGTSHHIYQADSFCVCVCACLLYKKTWQSWEFVFSDSPPSLGGEGISGAGGVKGEAKLDVRDSRCIHNTHQRAPSHLLQIPFPVLGCKDNVVQDGPMDHLSISQVPFSSIKNSRSRSGPGSLKRAAVVGKSRLEAGGLSGVLWLSLTAPRGKKGGRGWKEGWIGMPKKEKKKYLSSLQ